MGSIPNFLFCISLKSLNLQPEKSYKTIKIADVTLASSCYTVRGVPICFGGHLVFLNFLVVR